MSDFITMPETKGMNWKDRIFMRWFVGAVMVMFFVCLFAIMYMGLWIMIYLPILVFNMFITGLGKVLGMILADLVSFIVQFILIWGGFYVIGYVIEKKVAKKEKKRC